VFGGIVFNTLKHPKEGVDDGVAGDGDVLVRRAFV